MVSFSLFKESIIKAGKRTLKVLQYGVKTAYESAPFGIDASPTDNLVAIYADTDNNSESVIIGYINTKQIAGKGEIRLYSLDSNNNQKTFLWLKSDGTLELAGNQYTAVRFEPLNTAITQQITDINTELSKISVAIGGLGGSYIVTPLNVDLSNAKSNDIKIK